MAGSFFQSAFLLPPTYFYRPIAYVIAHLHVWQVNLPDHGQGKRTQKQKLSRQNH
jgi:hypothetical protein